MASAAAAITDAFVKFPGVERILGQGPTKVSIVTGCGLQVDLRVLPQEHFGAALLYFTGSKDHNVRIRGLAQKKGMTLNEWGLYDERRSTTRPPKKTAEAPPVKAIASRTEEEIYKHLGLALHRARAARRPRRSRCGASQQAPRSSSGARTSAAICTPTPPHPMAPPASRKWPRPRRRLATNTSPSPIIPRAR